LRAEELPSMLLLWLEEEAERKELLLFWLISKVPALLEHESYIGPLAKGCCCCCCC